MAIKLLLTGEKDENPLENPLELGLPAFPGDYEYLVFQVDIGHPSGLEGQEALHDLSTVRRGKDDLHRSRHLTYLDLS